MSSEGKTWIEWSKTNGHSGPKKFIWEKHLIWFLFVCTVAGDEHLQSEYSCTIIYLEITRYTRKCSREFVWRLCLSLLMVRVKQKHVGPILFRLDLDESENG